MGVSRADRIRMERAHVQAWPALDTALVDGWLWRSSGGGSQRANSVSTVDFNGGDLSAAIDAVEARYRARAAPARFHIFDATAPTDLEDALRLRGYRQASPTVTMFRVNAARADLDDAEGNEVECRDQAWPEWQDVYLDAITENRRAVNTRILRAISAPRAFFAVRRDNRIITTALCVIGCNCAVIECVATDPTARRLGAARAVMTRLLAWAARQPAALVGLQVLPDNFAAMRLYEDLGFVPGAMNRFWERKV